jgi:DNA-binding response OmpR family regulator
MESSPTPRRTSLLVVKDDARLRTLYGEVLTQQGYAAIAVEDGLEALVRIDRRPPDLVILDLTMPRLRGFDVLRELGARGDTRHVPVIIITAPEVPAPRGRNVAAVVQKPTDANALASAVRDCGRGWQLRTEFRAAPAARS